MRLDGLRYGLASSLEGWGARTHAVDLGASFGGESAEESGGTGGGEEARGGESCEGGATALAEGREHDWSKAGRVVVGRGKKGSGANQLEGNRLLSWSAFFHHSESSRATRSYCSKCPLSHSVLPCELPVS